MHQSHNIAWDSLSSRSAFIQDNSAITPRRTDLFPRRLDVVVKILLAENAMAELLMLAQHPRTPLHQLHRLGWDHTMYWALKAYIFFNVLLAKPELREGGRYKTKRVVSDLIESADFDAQSLPHRVFFYGSMERCVVRIEDLEPLGDGEVA